MHCTGPALKRSPGRGQDRARQKESVRTRSAGRVPGLHRAGIDGKRDADAAATALAVAVAAAEAAAMIVTDIGGIAHGMVDTGTIETGTESNMAHALATAAAVGAWCSPAKAPARRLSVCIQTESLLRPNQICRQQSILGCSSPAGTPSSQTADKLSSRQQHAHENSAMSWLL